MPFTPFHFGPGAALHAIAPTHVSFLSFCAVNVLIDFESLYNLVGRHRPVHASFHTYVDATIVIAITVVLFVVLRRAAERVTLPNPFQWQQLKVAAVVSGAILGGYSHVALDSIMHPDIRPLSPFSEANVLFGAVPLGWLHLLCVAFGVAGAVGVGLRWLLAGVANER